MRKGRETVSSRDGRPGGGRVRPPRGAPGPRLLPRRRGAVPVVSISVSSPGWRAAPGSRRGNTLLSTVFNLLLFIKLRSSLGRLERIWTESGKTNSFETRQRRSLASGVEAGSGRATFPAGAQGLRGHRGWTSRAAQPGTGGRAFPEPPTREPLTAEQVCSALAGSAHGRAFRVSSGTSQAPWPPPGLSGNPDAALVTSPAAPRRQAAPRTREHLTAQAPPATRRARERGWCPGP